MNMRPIKFFYLIAFIITINSCSKKEQGKANIETLAVKNITAYSAESGGIISPDGFQTVIYQGVCWSKEKNPTVADKFAIDNDGSGSFKSNIINLNAHVTYFARAFYITSEDTVYGNSVEFTTPDYIIGKAIPNETDLDKWGNFQIKTSAYCWYNNDVSNKNIYGAMYNWYAASDNRNIAPAGWHVSNVDDWQTLRSYLGGTQINSGYRLRESTTAHWISENFSPLATNETGFTALPGGKVTPSPFGFMDIGVGNAYFWTNTGTLDGSSCVYLASDISIDNLQPNCRGFNIRCVKD